MKSKSGKWGETKGGKDFFSNFVNAHSIARFFPGDPLPFRGNETTMQPIIEKIDPALIKAELTSDKFLRRTNKGGNEIYVVDAFDSPNIMREIGRLREISFRDAGGGTGKDCDIDEFDTMTPPCRQMLVWNPDDEEIIGGYRFILGRDIVVEDGRPRIATSHIFDMSPEFVEKYLPGMLELGRSFVVPSSQATGRRPKTIYALDNLWDGLGAITVKYPEVEYLFGKVTMYPSYGEEARDILLGFLHRYFGDGSGLVVARHALPTAALSDKVQSLFRGDDFREDYKVLSNELRTRGRHIPPLVNAYMSLSPTMKMFGTAINDEFGDVEESAIFFRISEIFEEKKRRHIMTYRPSETL